MQYIQNRLWVALQHSLTILHFTPAKLTTKTTPYYMSWKPLANLSSSGFKR